MSEMSAAWRRLKRSVRILICEELISLSLKVMPDDYTPSCIEGAVRGAFEWIGRPLPSDQ